MKHGKNIGNIIGDGYLVIPLSMSRLSAGQSPKEIHEILEYFTEKLKTLSCDVIFLYTGGLYFNSADISYKERTKYNNQMLNHSSALRNVIQKGKKFVPNAFHYLPFEYVVLNSKQYIDFFKKLKQQAKSNKDFRRAIQKSMRGTSYDEASENFILEEVTISHIIRQGLVEFPSTLVRNESWRLIVYSGNVIPADAFQWANNLLPKENSTNPFKGANYNFNDKCIELLDEA